MTTDIGMTNTEEEQVFSPAGTIELTDEQLDEIGNGGAWPSLSWVWGTWQCG